MRAVIATLIALSIAPPVLGQERDPSARQTLVDLAYVLGQAHALHQLCSPGDQHWRTRMVAMVETEASEHAFAERLRAQFNTGYVAGQSDVAGCTPQSRKAEAAVEARGAGLARRMAQARVPVAQAPESSGKPAPG